MSLKSHTPCDEQDWTGHYVCPYATEGDYVNCEYWCGADEPEDNPENWDENGFPKDDEPMTITICDDGFVAEIHNDDDFDAFLQWFTAGDDVKHRYDEEEDY